MKKYFQKCFGALTASLIALSSASTIIPQVSAEDNVIAHYECEDLTVTDAQITDNIYGTVKEGFTGEGFVWFQSSGNISFEVEVPKTDMYEVSIKFMQELDEGRLQYLYINGKKVQDYFLPYTTEWRDFNIGFFRLEEGVNTIEIRSGYGFAYFDTVTVSLADLDPLNVEPVLADKNATPKTQALMNYLTSVYGKNIISGQQEIYGGGNDGDMELEFDWIKNLTGELPAIRGFDYMNYNPLYGWDDGTTERLIDWVNEKNGIATVCWHINVPKDFTSYELGDEVDWTLCTYKNEGTTFDTAKATVEGTKENEYLMAAIEDLAEQLLICQEADVPIIFRPFHEAEGNGGVNGEGAWFWWSDAGAESYKELWRLLYDTLTEDYGLHNLIWEYNSYTYDSSPAWYPGDDCVDIVGFDKYNVVYNRYDGLVNVPNEDAITSIFYKLVELTNGKKMVAMPENDTIPNIENLTVEKAGWLYFCPWYGEHLLSETFNYKETLIDIYQSDYCITLDELPADLYGTSSNPTNPPEIKWGDANDDGLVTIADVVAAAAVAANPESFSLSASAIKSADVHNPGDGISATDASIIQELSLELIDANTLPIIVAS